MSEVVAARGRPVLLVGLAGMTIFRALRLRMIVRLAGRPWGRVMVTRDPTGSLRVRILGARWSRARRAAAV